MKTGFVKICGILFAVASSLATVHAASASVVIDGGDHAQRLLIRQDFYSCIPSRFRTSNNVQVQLLGTTQMVKYIHEGNPFQNAGPNGDDLIDGIYEDGPPLITLRATRPSDEVTMVFAHEYGHYVWADLLTPAAEKEFTKIYGLQKSKRCLVSEYAGTNVNEGFAEAFSFYSCHPAVLKQRDPVSYRFLKNLQVRPSTAVTENPSN